MGSAKNTTDHYNNTYIAILHHIQLAFLSVLAGFLDLGHARLAVVHGLKVVKGCHFGFDKAPFKVRVNDTGGLRRRRALHNGPRPDFLGTGRVIGLQAQGLPATTNHAGNH
jgi:hypothetical protein